MMTNVIALLNLLTSDKWSFFLIPAIMWFKEETDFQEHTKWMNDFLYREDWGEINLFNNSWVKNDNGLNDVSHSLWSCFISATEQEMIYGLWRSRQYRREEPRESHMRLGKLQENSWKVNYKESTLTYLNLYLFL